MSNAFMMGQGGDCNSIPKTKAAPMSFMANTGAIIFDDYESGQNVFVYARKENSNSYSGSDWCVYYDAKSNKATMVFKGTIWSNTPIVTITGNSFQLAFSTQGEFFVGAIRF